MVICVCEREKVKVSGVALVHVYAVSCSSFHAFKGRGGNLHRPRRMTFFALCSCLCVSVGGGK